MRKKTLKFVIPMSAIAFAALLLAFSATGESGDLHYAYTLCEAQEADAEDLIHNLKVEGFVKGGSILREDGDLSFTMYMEECGAEMPVLYVGSELIPDTFKDEVPALVEGRMTTDGTFHAEKVMAKCASKYEGMESLEPSDYQAPPPHEVTN